MNLEDRLTHARCALEGLSVGDAFGELFFRHRTAIARFWLQRNSDRLSLGDLDRPLDPPPWRWTDDTAMAIAVVETLRERGEIDRNDLANRFAVRYTAEPRRGYGPAMHRLLPQLRRRNAWQTEPRQLFGGQGSFGNGAAMRVAPVGAYFADDLQAAIENARRSAEVTHAHPEGIAGAIAVAAATALAWQLRGSSKPQPQEFLDRILFMIPNSEVAFKTQLARDLQTNTTIRIAATMLGNGSEVTAQDTVPFVLWSAAHHLDNYESALWHTASGLGDMDTTCAMVGGIVVMYTGIEGIPVEWLNNREPLPEP
ncbi:MAG TPA: ADP-ribosylglycohydrolase family protein [Anaerolineales bacterium]|nr:ADP-ribosylglycohydrolase family protein [Anaerolineales bacterium]